MDDLGKAAQLLKHVLPMVYSDLLSPSVRALGSGLGNIVEWVCSPTYRLHFASEANRKRYQCRAKGVLDELVSIPEHERAEIPSSIGAPIMEQLAIETDDGLVRMFQNLLLAAAHKDTAAVAHPSFVYRLRHLSPDEALLIEYLRKERTLPFIKLRYQFTETEWLDQTPVLMGIETEVRFQLPENLPLYISNFVGLGILEKGNGALADFNRWYKRLEELYKPQARELHLRGHGGKQYPITMEPGYYNITPYGRLFFHACTRTPYVPDDTPSEAPATPTPTNVLLSDQKP